MRPWVFLHIPPYTLPGSQLVLRTHPMVGVALWAPMFRIGEYCQGRVAGVLYGRNSHIYVQGELDDSRLFWQLWCFCGGSQGRIRSNSICCLQPLTEPCLRTPGAAETLNTTMYVYKVSTNTCGHHARHDDRITIGSVGQPVYDLVDYTR